MVLQGIPKFVDYGQHYRHHFGIDFLVGLRSSIPDR